MFLFTPNVWGFMIQFEVRICFKWVWEKPPYVVLENGDPYTAFEIKITLENITIFNRKYIFKTVDFPASHVSFLSIHP